MKINKFYKILWDSACFIKETDENKSVASKISNDLITSIDEFNLKIKEDRIKNRKSSLISSASIDEINDYEFNTDNNLEESFLRDSFASADLDLKNTNKNSFNIELKFKSPTKRRNSEYHTEFKFGIKSNIGKINL